MLYRYRCTRTGCRLRLTLRTPNEWRRRPRACPACHGRLAQDHYRHTHEVGPYTRNGVCRCGGLAHPHRRGSLGCDGHPGPSAQQLLEAFGPYACEMR